MATMTVKISSKETIKPSSPTPQHLRNHNLSFMDQLAPNMYIPIILFYQAKNDRDIDHVQRSSQLKKSLQQTLNLFYPLAGTIKEDYSIDCNDSGVEFCEARIGCQLSEVLQQFDTEILNQFLPFGAHTNGAKTESREVLLAIQYNIFQCGGVAIGVFVSHRIADGTSATTFLNAWSATSRGDAVAICPKFDVANFFPKKDMNWYKRDNFLSKEKVVTRRLVFNKSSIAALREKASPAADSHVKAQHYFPTRVEAVSALIWGRLMAISKSKPAPAKFIRASHAVNLRVRMVPPMPMYSFGNLWYNASAIVSPNENVDSDNNLVILGSKLNTAIKKINDDCVKQLQSDAILDSLKKAVERYHSIGDMESYNFTSWCMFRFYDVDFGWGKPTWVCCPSMPFKNLIVMMSTKDEQGIEAYVNISEEDSIIFDGDLELLPFVSRTIGD
ncbi:stemmadenine O-acetyltransferase-like [Juglans microcarpa x Juglans regia]|uniref:stemmadenine O-acetyltransferase-like n=1 Tax=Juglans microcarpa x Juglans regia TaxID=2249226 RepID=UPI001B7EAE5A|nr:stemmadenine O-acetyltransferase-like [Juglans microcarpa x Juglans regia]